VTLVVRVQPWSILGFRQIPCCLLQGTTVTPTPNLHCYPEATAALNEGPRFSEWAPLPAIPKVYIMCPPRVANCIQSRNMLQTMMADC